MSFRLLSFLGFLACAAGMAFALYMEFAKGYEPCPMCIFQRVAMIGAGLFFLAATVHGPRAVGRWIYALLAAAASLAGAGIAGRHVWLQSLPEDQVPACGPALSYLMDMAVSGGNGSWAKIMASVLEVVQMVLKGDGNCAKIDAQWLGVSLPGWTLIAFIGIALFALVMPKFSRAHANTF